MNKLKTKFLSLILTVAMAVTIMPANTFAQDETKDTVSVEIRSQMGGAYLHPLKVVDVDKNLAESYGYTDKITNGVSALDALVKAHEIIYGEEFTKETAKDYLDVPESGFISKIFGEKISSCGFFLNEGYPNDGTPAVGGGYNGTTVTTQEIKDKDVLDFFIYQSNVWSDYFTWVNILDKPKTSMSLPVKVTGYMAAYAYKFKTPEDVKEGSKAFMLEDMQLAWVDKETGEVEDIEGAITDENGETTVKMPNEEGTKYLVAYPDEDSYDDAIMNPAKIDIEQSIAPKTIDISLADTNRFADGKLFGFKGETYKLNAVDENGDTTPVKWSTSTSPSTCSIDENGTLTINNDTASGQSSYIRVTATSVIDSSVSKQYTISLAGFKFSDYQKYQDKTLSEDGQKEVSVSVSGGYKGHTKWSYDTSNKEAVLAQDPQDGTSAKFIAKRPGVFSVSARADFDITLRDTAYITIKGLAVEDEAENNGKTYVSTEEGNNTIQLKAFGEDKNIIWTSDDESIASVDEKGVVTGNAVGSVIISAKDGKGNKGGIKVVVKDSKVPYFENLQFLTTALDGWTADMFKPATLNYDLKIKNSTTTKLILQNTTVFSDNYKAVAQYTDINGENQNVDINNGAITYLDGIAFDTTPIKITLSDKENENNKTEYILNVTRPRGTNRYIKSISGIIVAPENRQLLTTMYDKKAEGTIFRAKEDGSATTSTGTNSTVYYYRTYLFNDVTKFNLNLTPSEAYSHVCYSIDDGQTWKETKQGGGLTDSIAFGEENVKKILIRIVGDYGYEANKEAGKDGFTPSEDVEISTYTLYAQKVDYNTDKAQIIEAVVDKGDIYSAFSKDVYSYGIVVPNGTTTGKVTFSVTENAIVKIASAVQKPNEEGKYVIDLTTYKKTISIYSEDSKICNNYTFQLLAKSKYNVPDKVVDYLCINSQYTNAGYGLAPETTLSGNLKSLGNFGGYITYYYNNGITNNPNNKYGVDFFVYGNAIEDTSSSTGYSFFEPGQVWVSEDGQKWYALAGSEHYEESTVWNYYVDYTKADNGNTAWTDSLGNSNDGTSYSGAFVNKSLYYLNNLISDRIRLSGILLPSANGDSASYGTTSDANHVSFGYSDCFVNNSNRNEAVNPYLDNTNHKLKANGFDLAWAVDEAGMPVDVNNKEFHYVKVVTASNMYHTSFKDKSTEVESVIKADADEETVGKTTVTGLTFTNNNNKEDIVNVELEAGKNVYEVDLKQMRYASLKVNGAQKDANIYVNNTRIADDKNNTLDGIKLANNGEKLIRVIVQDGEKEPAIYLLKVITSTVSSKELINKVNVNYDDVKDEAITNDGVNYSLKVGKDVNSISLGIATLENVTYKINNEEAKDSYDINEGENVFEITATDNISVQKITLTITRQKASEVTGQATVKIIVLGDDVHGKDSENVHTYADGNLKTWMEPTEITMDCPATVVDVIKKAFNNKLTYVNASGNYITEINGLKALDNGPNSGWMYVYNGIYSNYGVADQEISDGDEIIVHYTDDYNKENWSGTPENTSTIAKTQEAINKIGEVTLDSKDIIEAARNEYSKLSKSQQNFISVTALEKAEYKLLKLENEDIVQKLEEAKKIEEIRNNTPGVVMGVDIANKSITSITLKWLEDNKATNYEIYRATSENGNYVKLATVNNKVLSYKDTNIIAGKTYYYKVKAINGAYIGEMSKLAYATAAPYQTKSAYVHNYGKNAFKIGWAKQSGVTGYRVYKSTSRNGSYERIATIKGDKNTTFADKNVKKGKTYYYKVRAYKLSSTNKMIFGSYSGIKYRKR